MSSEAHLNDHVLLDVPKQRRSPWGYLTIFAAVMAVGGVTWAWQSGYRPPFYPSRQETTLSLVEVDEGDITAVITENGTIESASNTIVRCEVEALIGMVGGSTATTGTGNRSGGSGGSASGQAGGGGGSATTSGGTAGTTGGAGSQATARAQTKSGSSSSRSGASAAGAAGGGTSKTAAASGSGAASGSAGSATTASSTSTGTTSASQKPVIRSFTYQVVPHMPLRPATKTSTSTQAKGAAIDTSGGGRGGRRGGGGGGMFGQEKPGSTRIISILPEGTRVKAGQVVCELDSSAFKDELQAQKIRYAQAKSWVDQATAILQVNEITLREYRDGIYPQDMQLIRQYVQTCQIERDRAENTLKWSRGMASKGFRTSSQVEADALGFQQTDIALAEAKGMLERLEKFTAPKIIKSLEAKLQAIKADKLMQDGAFALEDERLKRLEKNIERCTLRAPIDGSVVYINQTNAWGRVEQNIEQGITVREGQPLFELPDPRRMRVKARINETKVGQIHSGQSAIIQVDAFPEKPLRGTVAEVTAISAPLNGPFSDVRIYFATVNIEEGFNELRPGLSTEVFFRSDARKNVARVPIQTVRWVKDKAFVAVHVPSRGADREEDWAWRQVELGLSDPDFVEVLSGVRKGDRVVADPLRLPLPDASLEESTSSEVASLSLAPGR